MKNKKHILFVCAMNQWRSPTAVAIYAKDQRLEVKSAGISKNARKRINHDDIKWADLILVMEEKHKKRIKEQFNDIELPRIESLDIPDIYGNMDEELQDLIRQGTENYLA